MRFCFLGVQPEPGQVDLGGRAWALSKATVGECHQLLGVAMNAQDPCPHTEGLISSFQGLHLFISPFPSLFPQKGPWNKVGLSSVSPLVSLCPSLSSCLSVSSQPPRPPPPLEMGSGAQFTTHDPTVSSVHARRLLPGNVGPCGAWARTFLLSAGKASPPTALSAGSASCLLLREAGDCRVCGPQWARPREGLSPHQRRWTMGSAICQLSSVVTESSLSWNVILLGGSGLLDVIA